jgi:hypothetical protein
MQFTSSYISIRNKLSILFLKLDFVRLSLDLSKEEFLSLPRSLLLESPLVPQIVTISYVGHLRSDSVGLLIL